MNSDEMMWSSSLLMNKLFIPPLQQGVVERNRLFQRLNDGFHRKLIFISAPAGFGKTSLLSSWARQSEWPVYWLSLDERDNDLTRFLNYLVFTIAPLSQDTKDDIVTTLLHSSLSQQMPMLEAILTRLLNEMASVCNESFLILDDYHFIQAPQIHRAMAFLLENLPENFHLVIASRSALPLSLARLRLDEQVLVLQNQDLRFTDEEGARFFKKRSNIRLSETEIAALILLTEGWIAGLKLFVLSLEEHPNPSEFIMRFKGGRRYLFEYLSSEILSRQSEEMQGFLLKTSILERFNAAICNVITGREDSQAMITALEKANLFILPLDDEKNWYRYHNLFSEFLRSNLRKALPLEITSLHEVAASWHANNGNIEAAIEHAVAAENYEYAEALILAVAKGMLMRSEITTLKGWIKKLPKEWVLSRPSISLMYAWTLVLTYELDDFEPYLKEAGVRAGLFAETTAIRTFAASLCPDGDKFVPSQQELEALSGDSFSYNLISIIVGYDHLRKGRLMEAAELIAKTARNSHSSEDIFNSVLAFSSLAHCERALGNLHNAADYARQALKIATENRRNPLTVASIAYHELGDICYERNELALTIHYLKESIKLDKQWRNLDNLLLSYLDLSSALRAKGEAPSVREEVQAEIERLFQLPELAHWRPYINLIRASEALIEGDLAFVNKWHKHTTFSLDSEINLRCERELTLLTELLIIQDQLDEAMRIAGRLLEFSRKARRGRMAIVSNVLRAQILWKSGDTFGAHMALEEAMVLAEGEGFIRLFIDRGESLAPLLQEVLKENTSNFRGFAKKLLSLMGKNDSLLSGEMLSDRELEVLRLIAEGRSNKEISAKLCIAVCTVKTHIQKIFGKFGVNSRTEALFVAKERGYMR